MIAAQVAKRYRTAWGPSVPAGICCTCGADTQGSGTRDDDRDLHCPDCIDDPDRAPLTLRTGVSPWANVT